MSMVLQDVMDRSKSVIVTRSRFSLTFTVAETAGKFVTIGTFPEDEVLETTRESAIAYLQRGDVKMFCATLNSEFTIQGIQPKIFGNLLLEMTVDEKQAQKLSDQVEVKLQVFVLEEAYEDIGGTENVRTAVPALSWKWLVTVSNLLELVQALAAPM